MGSADVAAGPAAASAAAPVQAPVAVATAALPAKILACYFTAWDTGRYRITDVPTDFNLIYVFHAKPQGARRGNSHDNVGDGSFMFEHYDAVPAAQVQACRARGQKVILTVGGARAGYAWDERWKSANFVDSFKVMVDRLGGVDGIDFNNYEAGIVDEDNFEDVSTEMVWIARQLKAIYGDGFAITSPPQPNDLLQLALMGVLKAAGLLSYAAPQYYDWSGFNASGVIQGATERWTSLLGAQNVLVGLAANYSNGPSLEECVREWNNIKGQHPQIRGAFCWSAQTNLAGGNAWGSTMKTRL